MNNDYLNNNYVKSSTESHLNVGVKNETGAQR